MAFHDSSIISQPDGITARNLASAVRRITKGMAVTIGARMRSDMSEAANVVGSIALRPPSTAARTLLRRWSFHLLPQRRQLPGHRQ